MKLTVKGSRNRNVKNADPNTGEYLWCPDRPFYRDEDQDWELKDMYMHRPARQLPTG